MEQLLKVTGHLQFDVYEKKGGKLLYSRKGPNLVTNVGFAYLAGLISGTTTPVAKYIALGITNTAAAATDTTLASEITTNGGARTEGTADRTTTTVTNDTARFVATFTFTGSFSIVEAGLFDLVSAGVLVARRVFGAVAVVNGNVGVATWTIKVS